jgi:hypothetical protein
MQILHRQKKLQLTKGMKQKEFLETITSEWQNAIDQSVYEDKKKVLDL